MKVAPWAIVTGGMVGSCIGGVCLGILVDSKGWGVGWLIESGGLW